MHQLTQDLHLSVRNLRHHTLYAVGVVACHAPTNCTFTEEGQGTEPPSVAKYHLCKLCSSVPAQAAATTALNSKFFVQRFSVFTLLFCYCRCCFYCFFYVAIEEGVSSVVECGLCNCKILSSYPVSPFRSTLASCRGQGRGGKGLPTYHIIPRLGMHVPYGRSAR